MSKSGDKEKFRQRLAHAFIKSKKAASVAVAAAPAHQIEAEHGTLHYIADSARLAGFMASVAIAQSFSGGKANPLGIWLGVLAACLFAYSFIHGLTSRKGLAKLPLFIITALTACLLSAYGWWLNEPPLISVLFKNASKVSWWRKYQIRRTMTHFARCLSDNGLDVPKLVSPVALGQQSMISSDSMLVGVIGIPKMYENSKIEISRSYGSNIFGKVFASDPRAGQPSGIGIYMATYAYAAYFALSCYNTPPSRVDGPWVAALWDAREHFGQEFMDRVLTYAFNGINKPFHNPGVFDREFYKMLSTGFLTMLTSPRDIDDFRYILAKHGINDPALLGAF